MATLSFIIDYFIEQIRKGGEEIVSDLTSFSLSSLSLSLVPLPPYPLSAAHVLLSLRMIENVVLQYFFWIGFPLVFVLFAVGFVQVMSIHAIGMYVHWLLWG